MKMIGSCFPGDAVKTPCCAVLRVVLMMLRHTGELLDLKSPSWRYAIYCKRCVVVIVVVVM